MLAWPSWTPCYDERMHSILSTLMICGRFFFSALVSVLPSGTWVASSTRGKAESIKTRCGFYKRRANAEFVASPRTVGCVSVRNLTHHIPNVYLLSHVWASVFNLHSITLSLSLFFFHFDHPHFFFPIFPYLSLLTSICLHLSTLIPRLLSLFLSLSPDVVLSFSHFISYVPPLSLSWALSLPIFLRSPPRFLSLSWSLHFLLFLSLPPKLLLFCFLNFSIVVPPISSFIVV